MPHATPISCQHLFQIIVGDMSLEDIFAHISPEAGWIRTKLDVRDEGGERVTM